MLKSCKETSAQMFGKNKLPSTWKEHPSHIREIVLIKLSHLNYEYGEKEGLAHGCIAKGRKEGTGGGVLRLIVGWKRCQSPLDTGWRSLSKFYISKSGN